MRCYVYVDGFNFYYGAVQNTPYKWLDFVSLSRRMFPTFDIQLIRYFTAKITSRANDPGQRLRQETYLRALKTCPEMRIHEGNFETHKVSRKLVRPLADGTDFAWVWDTKEKGSDVNLATFLLTDGFRNAYDTAIVVSNDADLITPIDAVHISSSRQVHVLDPDVSRPRPQGAKIWPRPSALAGVAASVVYLTTTDLSACQLPPVLSDKNGTISKPVEW